MKIRSICLVRNEVDVIEACLQEASLWPDEIYVYDGASDDGTWEKVQAMADGCIIPWKSDNQVFRESLRADVFNDVRHKAKEGDWWCQLNADEFYVEDPRAFLEKVPASDHVVWGLSIEYFLTDKDIASREYGPDFRANKENIRYYKAFNSERRFFRHRNRLIWSADHAWPKHLGVVHQTLLPVQHYPFRSPQQIQTRLDVRRRNRERGFAGWDHAKQASWQEKIAPADALHYDSGNGQFIIETERLPAHLEKPFERLYKKVLHGTRIWP